MNCPYGYTERQDQHKIWWLLKGQENVILSCIQLVQSGNGTVLKGGRGTTVSISIDAQSRAVIRRYRRGGLVRHFLTDIYWGYRTRPFKELHSLTQARKRGVPTVEVLGAGVERLSRGFYRGVLITREAEGYVNLAQWLDQNKALQNRLDTCEQVLETVRLMHDKGIYHPDLNVSNVLVSQKNLTPKVMLLDFDRARIYTNPVRRTLRKRSIKRFQRSINKFDPEGKRLPLSFQRQLTMEQKSPER